MRRFGAAFASCLAALTALGCTSRGSFHGDERRGCSTKACGDPGAHRVVVIGDYGLSGPNEAKVAALAARLEPDFVITTGDNNYPCGQAATIDENIGRYYHLFIAPYAGSFGAGAREPFLPSARQSRLGRILPRGCR